MRATEFCDRCNHCGWSILCSLAVRLTLVDFIQGYRIAQLGDDALPIEICGNWSAGNRWPRPEIQLQRGLPPLVYARIFVSPRPHPRGIFGGGRRLSGLGVTQIR
jgi:hypothetical protein